jgi:OOP family OmpA-OmpF porin
MKLKLVFVAFALGSLSVPALGQSTKILKGQDLTEAALIEALTPDPVTRSIRVQPNAPAPKPASASLLITFETNSAELSRQARQQLDVVGRALQDDKLADFRFSIEGHADPRGGSELNQRLSQARAESVRQYLVRNHGVGEERLSAIGKGDRELFNQKNPVAPENRRVTIVTNAE